ncbi:MAG: carboxypeptidase-like regulatory domain-containing protein [Oscillatoria sp. PMC 1068.18]|nr:carboxypeptidase-like regulatory domain-containing protein [Oscillatoria sp. PMC 1076.18]MEC4990077.1 carboxypeptidase-like regulatory domain-containing protein [Oscillatoria sp. PMC 1068.18]
MPNYQLKYLIPLLYLPILSWSTKALSHGANIQYRQTEALQIKALYDDGKPMANAQVTVYSPDDPATPWLTGTTNNEGEFTFAPDLEKVGNWEVKVRQAGHGDITTIPVGESTLTNQSEEQFSLTQNGNYTPLQKAVMAVVGLWGFIGTALFFSRKKANN